MDAIETMNKIKEVAKKNHLRAPSQKTRFITKEKISAGECFRQGDIYIFRMDFEHPVGEMVKRNQIADGFSIGSRHILNGNFKIYTGIKGPECLNDIHAKVSTGYAFDVEENTVLGHPEHDNYVFKFSCRWQVVHQIDLRTLKKVQD